MSAEIRQDMCGGHMQEYIESIHIYRVIVIGPKFSFSFWEFINVYRIYII